MRLYCHKKKGRRTGNQCLNKSWISLFLGSVEGHSRKYRFIYTGTNAHTHICAIISGCVLKLVSDSNSWQGLLWPSYFSSFSICEEPSSHYPQCICLPAPAPPYVTRLSPLGTLAKTSALIKNKKTLFPLILLSWEQICDGGSLLGERLGRRRHRKICFLVYSVSFIGDCFILSALFTYIGKHAWNGLTSGF